MIKYKTLKHSAIDDRYEQIQPIKNFIPEFYKTATKYFTGNKLTELPSKPTFKMCSVFGDSFITGYAIPLIVDIFVTQEPNGTNITWNDKSHNILVNRPYTKELVETTNKLPVPIGCSDQHLSWITNHIFEIPKGYSALVTHPLNRHDLPFVTLSGIIDNFVVHEGQIPVYFSSKFEGVVSAGTPIAQILLFKRENWKSKLDTTILKIAKKNKFLSETKAYGWYKNNVWNKKRYE